MKEVDLIIPHERLNDVNRILYKHKVGGMYFHEITGEVEQNDQREKQLPMRDIELAKDTYRNLAAGQRFKW